MDDDRTRPIEPAGSHSDDSPGAETIQHRRDSTRPLRPGNRKKARPGRRVLLWVVIIFMASGTMIALASYLGIRQGEQLRYTLATAQVGEVALEQFNLGMEDYEAGRYDMALQRFEYVLDLEPDFPGVSAKIDEILASLNRPTRTPSPTLLTPTPTSRNVSLEDLYRGAEEAAARSDWTVAIDTLITLRGYDLTYRTDEVETMLYLALRSRGLDRIYSGDHEQGIYDLNQAERLGALDQTARSWRNSAAFYLTANSYLGIDWEQAAIYFGQICSGGTWDSCAKYAFASYNHAEEFLEEKDWCSAVYWYDESLQTYQNNDIVPTATRVARQCLTATAPTVTPTQTITMTPTSTFIAAATATSTSTSSGPAPTATEGGPTATATMTHTQGPTPTMTSTYTATATYTATEEAAPTADS